MRIALAQIRPFKGAIEKNIKKHKKFIERAIKQDADLIIFPELSITGYEPGLAEELTTIPSDSRFQVFQQLSNNHQIKIGIGAPLKQQDGISISHLFFHPESPVQVYSKQYLHPDEFPYFEAQNNESYIIHGTNIGLAICYELSIPAHFESCKKEDCAIYLSSIAKTEKGVENASKRLAHLAKNHNMTTLMVNCIGPADNFLAYGQSAIWNKNGELIAQLKADSEGLLIY